MTITPPIDKIGIYHVLVPLTQMIISGDLATIVPPRYTTRIMTSIMKEWSPIYLAITPTPIKKRMRLVLLPVCVRFKQSKTSSLADAGIMSVNALIP